jgi:hypothetical protein
MFVAMGSCASIAHVQEKSSACVEVLRRLSHEMASWFLVRDFNCKRTEVSINADITALCLDISVQKIHFLNPHRKVLNTTTQRKNGTRKNSAVRDVLLDGMKMLMDKGMYGHWLKRTGAEGTDLYGSDSEAGMNIEMQDDMDVEGAFGDPDGRMEVDPAMDPDFAQECPFSNVDISTDTADI